MNSLKAMAKAAKSKKKPSEPKKESKKAAEPIYKSAEFIEDSDEDDNKSDDDSEGEDEAPLEKHKVSIPESNGKLVAAESSGSSSCESESESGSDAEEGSSSEESEDEEIADSDSPLAVEEESAKKSAKEPVGRTVSFKTAPYKPPTGFEQGKLDGTCKASQMFKKSNLEGKQIWYFTAPASVPVSSIESMSLLDVKYGKPVMEHNGGDYTFMQDSAEDKTYKKIMVPNNSSDDGYKTTPRSIDQIFHLQQIVKLKGVVDDAPTNNHSCVRVKKPARPQPKGLKMRFRPLGFGSGNLGNIGSSSSSESDEEMGDAPAAPEITPMVSKSKAKSEKHTSETPSLKRKHTESEGKKSKNSSSSTTENPDNKMLKRLKKYKTESQTVAADRPSVSTNVLESSTYNRQLETTIPLPTPQKPSQASDLTGDSRLIRSPRKINSKKDRELPTAPATEIEGFLKESTGVADSSLLSKEQRKKVKKAKKADGKGSGG